MCTRKPGHCGFLLKKNWSGFSSPADRKLKTSKYVYSSKKKVKPTIGCYRDSQATSRGNKMKQKMYHAGYFYSSYAICLSQKVFFIFEEHQIDIKLQVTQLEKCSLPLFCECCSLVYSKFQSKNNEIMLRLLTSSLHFRKQHVVKQYMTANNQYKNRRTNFAMTLRIQWIIILRQLPNRKYKIIQCKVEKCSCAI